MPTPLPVRTTRYTRHSPWLALLILGGCALAVLTLPAYAVEVHCFSDTGSLSRVTFGPTLTRTPFPVYRARAEFFWQDWEHPTGTEEGFLTAAGRLYTLILPGGAPQWTRHLHPVWPNTMQVIDCSDALDWSR